MMIIEIMQIVVGIPLALILPGYFLVKAFFNELEAIEKIALSFVLSISITIFLGLFLGYNETMRDLTGGITAVNLWIYLSAITVVLASIYIIREPEEVLLILNPSRKKRKK